MATPGSTVNTTTPNPINADMQDRMNATVDQYGKPRDAEERDLYNKMTFTSQQLKDSGIKPEAYDKLAKETGAAREGWLNTPEPTNDKLAVLQDALKAKSGVGDQKLGESELYQKLGISGYATLRQSLGERQKEMQGTYDSFAQIVSAAGGSLSDSYNTALNKYQILKDELDTADQRVYSLLDEATEWERLMQKMKLQHEYDMELDAFTNDITDGATAGDPRFAGGLTIDGDFVESPELTDMFGLGEEKGWCGTWASTLSTATKVGNSWGEKASKINTQTPTIGDKLLVPLGVTDGKGYGHVAVVLGYDPQSGNIVVVESNRNGRQNRGEGDGIATLGMYNLSDLKQKYGTNFGFATGELRPEYADAPKYVSGMADNKAASIMQYDKTAAPYPYQDVPGIPEGTFSKDMRYAEKNGTYELDENGRYIIEDGKMKLDEGTKSWDGTGYAVDMAQKKIQEIMESIAGGRPLTEQEMFKKISSENPDNSVVEVRAWTEAAMAAQGGGEVEGEGGVLDAFMSTPSMQDTLVKMIDDEGVSGKSAVMDFIIAKELENSETVLSRTDAAKIYDKIAQKL